MQRNTHLLLALALFVAGCKSAAPDASPQAGRPPANQSNATANVNPSAPAMQPVAYVDGRPVSVAELRTGLLEAAGGQVLSEWLLDAKIEQELARRNLKVGPTLRDAEQQILGQRLSADPDEAQRLINELRLRRGLGEERFKQLLHRSAGLRLLVQTQVEISDAAVQQAFELSHGPRYEARLIVAERLTDAADLVRRARQGESFIDLAIAHSTDSSRAQGGLLPLVSPADATFPDVIRKALVSMEDQQVSDPIGLEQGFAILKLERKIPSDTVKLDDVKDQLAERVRRQVEDMLIRRMRASLVAETDIVILDPALNESWKAWTRTDQP